MVDEKCLKYKTSTPRLVGARSTENGCGEARLQRSAIPVVGFAPSGKPEDGGFEVNSAQFCDADLNVTAGMQEPDQYLLDLPELQERDLPTLDNFVVGANAEVVAVLREMAQGSGPKFLYLYGPQGCGLTHLLKAVNPGNGTSQFRVPVFKAGTPLYTVDDVHDLDLGYARQLFALQNAVYADPAAKLICAGRTAPQKLKLAEAIRSRLAWGLSYAVKPLDEEERFQVLARLASLRGIRMTPDIERWMTTHLPRDMRTLTRVLDLANQLGLRGKRRVSLAVIREAADVLDLH